MCIYITTNLSGVPAENAVVKCNVSLLNINEQIHDSLTAHNNNKKQSHFMNEILFIVLLAQGKEWLQCKYGKSV